MKLALYHPLPEHLAKFSDNLSHCGHEVLFPVCQPTLWQRLVAFCDPIWMLSEPAAASLHLPLNQCEVQSIPLEGLILHPDTGQQVLWARQLALAGIPTGATFSSATEYRRWFAAQEPGPGLLLMPCESPSPDSDARALIQWPSFGRLRPLAELMRQAGYHLHFNPDQWQHAAAIASAKCLSSSNIKVLVTAAEASFAARQAEPPAGLDTLPACWLAQLPEIIVNNCNPIVCKLGTLPISLITHDEGMLFIRFAHESSFPRFAPNSRASLPWWDQIRIHLAASLYPSRWRHEVPSKNRNANRAPEPYIYK